MMKAMLSELERFKDSKVRRIKWLEYVTPHFETMGKVLLAQSKVLLPLLFYWLHVEDDSTCIMVSNPLSPIS